MASLFSRLLGGNQAQAQPQSQNIFLPSIGANVSVPAAAPAQQPQRRGPSLVDTVFGVAAGYSPGTVRRNFERADMADEAARAELAAAQRTAGERQQVLGQITDPFERAIAMSNLSKWGEARATGLESATLARGARRVGPNGQVIGNNPFQFQTGDEIVEQDEAGQWNPVYTRTAPSISERNTQERTQADIALGRGRLGVDQAELGLRQGELAYKQQADQETRAREQRERQVAAEGQNVADQNMIRSIENATSGIERYIDSSGTWTNPRSFIPQDRANLESFVTALQGVITLDGLAEMKANSPNGASGMGAMSEKEGQWLASRVAALDPNMSKGELQGSLKEITDFLQTIRDRSGRRATAVGGGSSSQISRDAALAELRRRGVVP